MKIHVRKNDVMASTAFVQSMNMVRFVRRELQNEVDDVRVDVDDRKQTVNVSVDYEDYHTEFTFTYDELGLPLKDAHDYENPGSYIVNTVLSNLDSM